MFEIISIKSYHENNYEDVACENLNKIHSPNH
jgi:hypothetical protein